MQTKKLITTVLAFAVWFLLFLGATRAFALTINTGDHLHTVTNNNMQPFGIGYEDDYTPELYLQGAQSSQVTLNGMFIQGSK